jgi:hypothetical protein
MSERIVTSFRRLFEVRLLHHYWLDDGATLFDALAADKRTRRLLTYDVRPLLAVRPTPATERTLEYFGGIWRASGIGLVVGAPADAKIAADTLLRFVVAPTDGKAFDYTTLTLRPQRVVETTDPTDLSADRKTWRFKENVAVLSNLTGAKRSSDLYLSQEMPGQSPAWPAEAIVLAAGMVQQLTADNPGAAIQALGAKADLPVFLHQADAPPIAPPPGVPNVPSRGVELSDEAPDDAFALIELTAKRPDDGDFSFVDGTGAPKDPTPVYQVRLKNRSTVRVYRDQRTGAVKSTDGPLPMTFFGNAGAGKKPGDGPPKADVAGGKITRIYSEIFV